MFDDGLYNKAVNCDNVILIPEYKYNIQNDKCLFRLMEILKKNKNNTIQRLNIKSIEDELFKDYKKEKKKWEIKKKYKVNDIIDVKNIDALNGEIVITSVGKKKYTIMYVDEKTKMIKMKNISHGVINHKYNLN